MSDHTCEIVECCSCGVFRKCQCPGTAKPIRRIESCADCTCRCGHGRNLHGGAEGPCQACQCIAFELLEAWDEPKPEVHTRLHEGVGPHEIPDQLPTGEQLVFTVSLGRCEDGRLCVSLNDTPIGPPVRDEETGAAIVAWFMGYLSTQVEGALKDHEHDQAIESALREQVKA